MKKISTLMIALLITGVVNAQLDFGVIGIHPQIGGFGETVTAPTAGYTDAQVSDVTTSFTYEQPMDFAFRSLLCSQPKGTGLTLDLGLSPACFGHSLLFPFYPLNFDSVLCLDCIQGEASNLAPLDSEFTGIIENLRDALGESISYSSSRECFTQQSDDGFYNVTNENAIYACSCIQQMQQQQKTMPTLNQQLSDSLLAKLSMATFPRQIDDMLKASLLYGGCSNFNEETIANAQCKPLVKDQLHPSSEGQFQIRLTPPQINRVLALYENAFTQLANPAITDEQKTAFWGKVTSLLQPDAVVYSLPAVDARNSEKVQQLTAEVCGICDRASVAACTCHSAVTDLFVEVLQVAQIKRDIAEEAHVFTMSTEEGHTLVAGADLLRSWAAMDPKDPTLSEEERAEMNAVLFGIGFTAASIFRPIQVDDRVESVGDFVGDPQRRRRDLGALAISLDSYIDQVDPLYAMTRSITQAGLSTLYQQERPQSSEPFSNSLKIAHCSYLEQEFNKLCQLETERDVIDNYYAQLDFNEFTDFANAALNRELKEFIDEGGDDQSRDIILDASALLMCDRLNRHTQDLIETCPGDAAICLCDKDSARFERELMCQNSASIPAYCQGNDSCQQLTSNLLGYLRSCEADIQAVPEYLAIDGLSCSESATDFVTQVTSFLKGSMSQHDFAHGERPQQQTYIWSNSNDTESASRVLGNGAATDEEIFGQLFSASNKQREIAQQSQAVYAPKSTKDAAPVVSGATESHQQAGALITPFTNINASADIERSEEEAEKAAELAASQKEATQMSGNPDLQRILEEINRRENELREREDALAAKERELAKAKEKQQEEQIKQLTAEIAELKRGNQNLENEIAAWKTQEKQIQEVPVAMPTNYVERPSSGLRSDNGDTGNAAAASSIQSMLDNDENGALSDSAGSIGTGRSSSNLMLQGSSLGGDYQMERTDYTTLSNFEAGNFLENASPVFVKDEASGKIQMCILNLQAGNVESVADKYECSEANEEDIKLQVDEKLKEKSAEPVDEQAEIEDAVEPAVEEAPSKYDGDRWDNVLETTKGI